MITDEPLQLAPPWESKAAWQAAHGSIDYHLYLHLNQLAIPLSQPINGYNATCCYLSSRGCSLPRVIRPWICTWYLCPVQTAHLKKRRFHQWKTFNHNIQEIKKYRRRLEEAFIDVVA